MRYARVIEAATGGLTVITGAGLALSIWLGGFIAPEAVVSDLVGFALILALIAVGVTLDIAASTRVASAVARTFLIIGALAMLVVSALSFIVYFAVPALLAVATAVFAFTHQPARATTQSLV